MSCCIICYRNCDNLAQIYNEAEKTKAKSDIKRFSKLFERYVNRGKDKCRKFTVFPMELNKFIEVGLAPCQECHNLMEDFCDIYCVLKETEMILDWRIKRLGGIMEHAIDSASFLEFIKISEDSDAEVNKVKKDVMEWRHEIATKCNEKLELSFPKLMLKRCRLEATCAEMSTPYNEPATPSPIGPEPSDDNPSTDINCETILDDNDELLEGVRAGPELEAPLNLDTGDGGNEQEMTIQAPLLINEDTENFNLLISNEIGDRKAKLETTFTDSSPVISTEEIEGSPFAKSRRLRSIHSCPKCSKTFSTLKSLQAHLPCLSSLEDEMSSMNEIICNVAEEHSDEYNPDELSVDESSSDSESENDLENIKEEVMSPFTKAEIFLAKNRKSHTIKDLNQPIELNQNTDLRNIKKETEKVVSPTKTRVGNMRLDKLRRMYKADSDIVEFLTFPCQIEGCSKILYSLQDFEDHKGQHGTFSCHLCQSLFDYAPDLARHELSNHCKEKTKCPRKECDFEGKSNQSYIQHVIVQHLQLTCLQDSRKFNCKICKVGFGQIKALRRHFPKCRIGKKSTKPIFKCDAEGCTKSFTTAKILQSHKYAMHVPGNKPVCQICNMTFSFHATLYTHMKKNHPESLTITCIVEGCEEKFVSEMNMESHVVMMHNSEKDKVSKLCPECGVTVVGLIGLESHLKRHERLEGFVCKTCDKRFKRKEAFDAHCLSHSGPESWQFQCEICAKKCLTKGKLDEHLRTHGNDKPFVCDICGAKYAHGHNLRIHVNSKHADLTKDVARKIDKTNFTSRKGVKRKRKEESHSFD